VTPELRAARRRRTTIARHLAEADVALDAIGGDFIHDMGLYSATQAIKALRYAIAELAGQVAELEDAQSQEGRR